MTERQISHEAMLASLHDIRLPIDAPGGVAAEIIAAIAIGLFLALAIGGSARLVSLRRPRRDEPSLQARIDALDELPEVERRRAALALLKQIAPDRLAELCPILFNPALAPSTASLVAELRGHV